MNIKSLLVIAGGALVSCGAIAGEMTDEERAIMMYEATFGQPSAAQTALWWEAGQSSSQSQTAQGAESEPMTLAEYSQMRHDEIVAQRNAGLERRAEQIDQIRGAVGNVAGNVGIPDFPNVDLPQIGSMPGSGSGELLRKVVPVAVATGGVITARTVTNRLTDHQGNDRLGADPLSLKQVVVRAAAAEIARNSVDVAFNGAQAVAGKAVGAGVNGAQRAGDAIRNRGN